jgi:quinone-modifying oxidoreductase subunit QmoC
VSKRLRIEPDTTFIAELRDAGGDSLKKCYQCATCSVVCELSGNGNVFPRKEMLWAQWGLKDRLLTDHSVWLCHQCNDCSDFCPRGARPGDVLAAVRSSVFRRFSFPAFMGKALASPAALPLLILVPLLVLVAIVLLNDDLGFAKEPPPVGTKGGYFKYFLPHGILEGLFITGNIVIFAFAAVGLVRFWNGLKSATSGGSSPGFLSSLYATVLEIMGHGKFRLCKANWTRSWAHLLVFFGFWAAFATAGLALFDMMVLGHYPPIPFFHPIKILGNLSAATLLIGSLALILRRIADREKVGANGYADWLFLINVFIVALTGVLTQVTRQTGPYELAYSVYFVHITAVFFLLWYAPYSKFAHMVYRTLALVHAKASQPGPASAVEMENGTTAGEEQKSVNE